MHKVLRLEFWEVLHNTNFNSLEFEAVNKILRKKKVMNKTIINREDIRCIF